MFQRLIDRIGEWVIMHHSGSLLRDEMEIPEDAISFACVVCEGKVDVLWDWFSLDGFHVVRARCNKCRVVGFFTESPGQIYSRIEDSSAYVEDRPPPKRRGMDDGYL